MNFVIPDNAVSHFHLRPGDKVADLGAGSGHFTKALSRAVGGAGKVFAVEIQRELAERLANTARTDRLLNVDVIWGDLETVGGTKIGDGALDAAVMANVLFQLTDKDGALSEVQRTLATGGKLFVIDWSESFGGMGPAGGAVVDEHAARELITRHGFAFDRTFAAGAHHYGLAFHKT